MAHYGGGERSIVSVESLPNDRYIDDRFLARALKRRWQWLAAGLVLGIVAAVAVAAFMPRSYTAMTSVFLDPLIGNPYSPTTPSSRSEQLAALTTEAGVVLTDAVIEDATQGASRQGFDIEPVRPNTATEIPSNSQVIEISFTSSDPEAARAGAQELATAFLTFRHDRAVSVYAAQAALLEDRRVAVSALLDGAREQFEALTDGDTAQAVDLEQQIRLYAQQLADVRLEQTELATRTPSAGTILREASTPTEPDGLSIVILTAAPLLFFAFLGLLTALLAEHADRRILDEEDILRWGAPDPLGDVGAGRRSPSAPFLRALPGVEEALADGAIVLVSVGAHSSGATAALGFANAAALSGRSVCVVGTSRRPGASSDGLSNVLDGSRKFTDVGEIYLDQGHGVSFLVPGTAPSDLPSLVQTDRCPALISHLTASFDLVIVESNWQDEVVAVRLSRLVGAALLIATKGVTAGHELLDATSGLRRLGVAVGGTILADHRPTKRRARRSTDTAAGEARTER